MELRMWQLACLMVGGVAFLLTGPVQADTLVLNDPLQGSTSGGRSGGTFVPGGWRVDNQYDSIYWHVPTMSHGAFEYEVTGLGSNCPGGAGYKNELSHMYDHTFNNADNQYSPGYQNDPYKHFLRKQCEAGKENTMEIVWQILPGGTNNFLEDDTADLAWNTCATYHFRVEWQNAGGSSTLKTYRNGALIMEQTLPGSWSPGGQSVRIAASTRRMDEGAHVGAIYSNVKVYDLTGGPPVAPAVTAPASGATVNTSVVFVQWSGSPHTQYQVRINTANSPDAGTVWDSQQVGSDLSYTWTGTLPNNTAYYAFVRLANASGWSPWSAGRAFTVNTALVPAEPNIVRVNGTSLRDHNGPFLGVGVTYMRALQRCKYDRARFDSDCALLASKGFNYIRILSMVGWDGLEIAPVTFGSVSAWPDYDQQLKDCIDIAYNHGLRTQLTIFADAQEVMPGDAARMAHLGRILNAVAGREHKIIMLEVANESWKNGFPDANGISDVVCKGRYLADRTSIPVALSSPSMDVDGIVGMYAGSAADLATAHFSRNTDTCEGGWLPVRDPWWAAHLPGVPPVSSNEPIGAGSSVSTENDPLKLCSAAIFAYLANLPMYVYHSRAGTSAQTDTDPDVTFSETAGIDAYQFVRTLLPPDVSSWVRNDGLESAAPFTVYCNGQPNKYWAEVACGSAATGCNRNIGAIKGNEFVCYPMGIVGGGVTLQARRPLSFTAYNPLTGAVAYTLTKNTGEQFTLAQGPGAYLIKGAFVPPCSQSVEIGADLGAAEVQNCLYHLPGGDGDTVAATMGGRSCRQNVNPNEDFYFYFAVDDAFALQGSRPDLFITVNYFDVGSGTLSLQYDSNTGDTLPAFYQHGGSVPLGTSGPGGAWKSRTFHVRDAYFGNRQNGGADFRFGKVGGTFYIDTVVVRTQFPTDYDRDGDVDQDDFGHFQNCLSGTGKGPLTGCADSDLDSDGDVDSADLAAFASCMGGTNGDPGC